MLCVVPFTRLVSRLGSVCNKDVTHGFLSRLGLQRDKVSNNTEVLRFLVIVSQCCLGKYCPFCSARSSFKFCLFVAIGYLVLSVVLW